MNIKEPGTALEALREIELYYRDFIAKSCMRFGGMKALSLKLGMQKAYIASTLSKGSLKTFKKVVERINELEAKK